MDPTYIRMMIDQASGDLIKDVFRLFVKSVTENKGGEAIKSFVAGVQLIEHIRGSAIAAFEAARAAQEKAQSDARTDN